MEGRSTVITTRKDQVSKINKMSSKRKPIKDIYIIIISLVLIMLIWEIFGRQINPIFASYPTAIFFAFFDLMEGGTLVTAFGQSVQPLAVGYLLAAVVGIPIGLLIGRYRIVESAINIYVIAGYATPLVALIPLFVLWFGLGFGVKVAIVFTLTIFPIIINTTDGVKAVPKTMIEVGTAFVASQSAIMRKIIIPATIPHIMTGLRLGVGKAVIAMVIAEFFTSISGLGGIIINSGNNFDTAKMFVPVIILMILGVGLTALVGKLESIVAPWQDKMTKKHE
ncbi:ABC transporter permease [Mesobacillus harenae]|uniref:ABC transporter permease n=1 Tax=Mesobacillus harenae TaxID=2213203 RepID=UPI0018D8D2BD|nr:ABC transporter permease [Mesobacillus harenae]